MTIKLPWLIFLWIVGILGILGLPVRAQTNNYCPASANSNYYTATTACGSIGDSGEVDDYSLNITKTSYCISQANYSYYAGIGKVIFGQINNGKSNMPTASNPYPGYGDFTGLSTSAVPGDTIPISITSGAPAGATSYIAVYVDFNNNGIFEANEKALSASWKAGHNFTSNITTGTINVPLDSASANLRVRVMQSLEPFNNACGNIGNNGEVEDYTLVIQ